VVIAAGRLVLACAVSIKGGRKTLHLPCMRLADGARHALPVGVACALVGVIIGILTLTGAASPSPATSSQVGENSLFLSLLLTMLVCLVLGMGIPTIPNYIITSSIAAPALLQARRAADRQPHVRLLFRHHGRPDAAGGAGRLRRGADRQGSGLKIGCKAVQIAIAGFVVPYMAVYAPALMLQGNAPRAVGQACGANPYPLVVPCHRVVATGGGLGGFNRQGGGFLLDVKRWLLTHENCLPN
jgi:O-6-methylguanine DNA methyltransferase